MNKIFTTYIASDNTATNGTQISPSDQDIRVYQIIFGNPADGKITTLYNITNPINGSTDNIALKVTQPTAAAGKQYVNQITFPGQGLPLPQGGNIITDGSQITVLWGIADNSQI